MRDLGGGVLRVDMWMEVLRVEVVVKVALASGVEVLVVEREDSILEIGW